MALTRGVKYAMHSVVSTDFKISCEFKKMSIGKINTILSKYLVENTVYSRILAHSI